MKKGVNERTIKVLCLTKLPIHGGEGAYMKLLEVQRPPDVDKDAYLFECECGVRVIVEGC